MTIDEHMGYNCVAFLLPFNLKDECTVEWMSCDWITILQYHMTVQQMYNKTDPIQLKQ